MYPFFGFIVDQTQRIEEMTNASESESIEKVATTSAASPIAVVIKPDAMKKNNQSPGALGDSSASSDHSSQQQQSELKGKAKFANFVSKMIKSTSFKVLTSELLTGE